MQKFGFTPCIRSKHVYDTVNYISDISLEGKFMMSDAWMLQSKFFAYKECLQSIPNADSS